MTKEEKLVVIDSLAEQLNEYPHFYITNIEALNAEQTASLRRKEHASCQSAGAGGESGC